MKKLYCALTLFLYTACFAQDPCAGIKSIQYEGQTYNTIAVGNQCWFKENLNVGTMLQASQDETNNGIIEKYCYDNNPGNCAYYGGLYQWNEAMQYQTSQETVKGICPTGWHIPSETEFATLKAFVNSDGNSLKELGQGSGAGAGTNKSGFSALMSIANYNGYFFSPHLTYFWGSTEYDSKVAGTLYLSVLLPNVYIGGEDKSYGFEVRCLKDNNTSDVDNKSDQKVPKDYSMSQNYPNPFNPSTLIKYQLPENTPVLIKIYNSIGSEVATLVNEYQTAGSYQVSFDGSKLSSGIYYYEIWAGNFNKTSKMLLVK